MTTLLHNQDLSTVVTLYRHARILVEIKLGWKIGQERRDGRAWLSLKRTRIHNFVHWVLGSLVLGSVYERVKMIVSECCMCISFCAVSFFTVLVKLDSRHKILCRQHWQTDKEESFLLSDRSPYCMLWCNVWCSVDSWNVTVLLIAFLMSFYVFFGEWLRVYHLPQTKMNIEEYNKTQCCWFSQFALTDRAENTVLKEHFFLTC